MRPAKVEMSATKCEGNRTGGVVAGAGVGILRGASCLPRDCLHRSIARPAADSLLALVVGVPSTSISSSSPKHDLKESSPPPSMCKAELKCPAPSRGQGKERERYVDFCRGLSRKMVDKPDGCVEKRRIRAQRQARAGKFIFKGLVRPAFIG